MLRGTVALLSLSSGSTKLAAEIDLMCAAVINCTCAATRDAERLDARSGEVKSHKARADTVLYVKPFGM